MSTDTPCKATLLLRSLLALTFLGAHSMAAVGDERPTEPPGNPATMKFSAGGAIRMKLNKGTMKVVGVPDDVIRVSWRSTFSGDEKEVKVKLERSGESDATVVVDGPGERTVYRIEVPRRSDVAVHMRAGELAIEGIVGSMDVDLLAGEIDLSLPDPRRYRSVAASVTAGELDARPWRADTGGLWRSFKATGEGDFDLRVRLIAGQLTIHSE